MMSSAMICIDALHNLQTYETSHKISFFHMPAKSGACETAPTSVINKYCGNVFNPIDGAATGTDVAVCGEDSLLIGAAEENISSLSISPVGLDCTQPFTVEVFFTTSGKTDAASTMVSRGKGGGFFFPASHPL